MFSGPFLNPPPVHTGPVLNPPHLAPPLLPPHIPAQPLQPARIPPLLPPNIPAQPLKRPNAPVNPPGYPMHSLQPAHHEAQCHFPEPAPMRVYCQPAAFHRVNGNPYQNMTVAYGSSRPLDRYY